jgi:hypothetical protein
MLGLMAVASFIGIAGCMQPLPESILAETKVVKKDFEVAFFVRETYATDGFIFVLKIRNKVDQEWHPYGTFSNVVSLDDKSTPRLTVTETEIAVGYRSARVNDFSNHASIKVDGTWRNVRIRLVETDKP